MEQRQGVALLTGDVAAGFDTCPLCGNKLASGAGGTDTASSSQGFDFGMSKGGIEK